MNPVRFGKTQVDTDLLTRAVWTEKTGKIRLDENGAEKVLSFSAPKEAKEAFFLLCRETEETHREYRRPMTPAECLRPPLFLASGGMGLLLLLLAAQFLFPCEVTEKMISSGTGLALSSAFWILAALWAAVRCLLVPQVHILEKK